MKKYVRGLLLASPLLMAGLFIFLLLGPARRHPVDHTLPVAVPSAPTAVVSNPRPSAPPAQQTVLKETRSADQEPSPVITFVRSPSHEKVFSLIEQHQEAEAIVMLQEIVQANPGDMQAYTLLGQLHYQQDQLSEAISAWTRVIEADPNNAVVRANLDKALREKEAQSGFTREMTRHFTIKFEGAQNRYLYQTALGILEEAYGTVGRALRFYPNQEVIVYLYTDQQFFDVTRAPAWSGGVFDGKIRIPSKGFEGQIDPLKRILVHEYVHAAIYQMMRATPSKATHTPTVPVWLNEGVAQYLEPVNRRDAANNRMRAFIKRGAVIKLSALHDSFLGFDGAQAGLAYDASLSAVSYLADEFGLWRLKMVFEELLYKETVDEAMRSALLMSYDQFQARWEETLQ